MRQTENIRNSPFIKIFGNEILPSRIHMWMIRLYRSRNDTGILKV